MTQKWDLFAATGGDDLADAIEEAGIIMTERERRDFVPEVPYLPYRQAGVNNNPPEQQERQYVPAQTLNGGGRYSPAEWTSKKQSTMG